MKKMINDLIISFMISGVHDNSIISFINFKNDNIFVSVEVIITTKNSSLERLGLES